MLDTSVPEDGAEENVTGRGALARGCEENSTGGTC